MEGNTERRRQSLAHSLQNFPCDDEPRTRHYVARAPFIIQSMFLPCLALAFARTHVPGARFLRGVRERAKCACLCVCVWCVCASHPSSRQCCVGLFCKRARANTHTIFISYLCVLGPGVWMMLGKIRVCLCVCVCDAAAADGVKCACSRAPLSVHAVHVRPSSANGKRRGFWCGIIMILGD